MVTIKWATVTFRQFNLRVVSNNNERRRGIGSPSNKEEEPERFLYPNLLPSSQGIRKTVLYRLPASKLKLNV